MALKRILLSIFVTAVICCSAFGQKYKTEPIQKWVFKTNGTITSKPAIGADGTIYVGSNFDHLYAVNPDGSKKWAHKTKGWLHFSPSIGSDGTIYVGHYGGGLYAIKPDGSIKWDYKGSSLWPAMYTSAVIGSDGTIYVGFEEDIGDGAVYLYAINQSGKRKWKYKLGVEEASYSPAIGSDGTIFMASNDAWNWKSYFHAITPNGKRKWRYVTEDLFLETAPSIGSDGNIYIATEFEIFSINSRKQIIWSYENSQISTSAAFGNDGTIYFGSTGQNDYLYALNTNGRRKWRYRLGGDVDSTPQIGTDGTIYLGSDDNNLHAVLPNGKEKWKFETEGDVSSSPTIGLDGTIYFGSNDKNFYAIVDPPFIFKTQPESQEATIESSFTLKVEIESDYELSFQWYKNDNAIEGETDSTLEVTLQEKGNYYSKYCVAVTAKGITAKSKIAEITPPSPPSIIAEPNSVNADIGDSVTFSVKAESIIPIDYQWYKNGVAITDGRNEVLAIENVEQKDYSIYSVRLKNNSGKIVSKIVELLPIGLATLKPIITNQPKDIMVKTGGVAVFSVGVKGLGPMNYLWYKNGVAITGSNVEKLRIDNFIEDNYGAYSVRIKNDFGKAISNLVLAEKIVIKPSLSFKINSQLRVFENEDKLSPAVFKDILFFASNNHSGGYTQAVDPDGPRLSNTPRNDFGDLYAYNNKTGKILWAIELNSPATTSPTVDDNGNVFIATKATTEGSGWVDEKDILKPSKIHCIDNKGKVLWSYELKSDVYSKPAIGKDGTIYFGSNDDYLYAVNSKGVQEWRYRTDEDIKFSPVIGSDGTIYFGSNDDHFYAVNPEGKLIWKHKTNNDIKGSAAIGDDGVIYFCTNDTTLHALKSDGKIKWELKLFDSGTSGTPAIGSNGIIYAISDYGIHAVDMNGKELWKRKLSGRYDYNPSIGFENTIVLGNNILSGITGEIIKTLPIKKDTILNVYKGLFEWYESEEQPDIYTGAGAVIGGNGNIYFSDSSFNYYCYKIPGFGIANSTWPMLGANPKRNSNINSIINWVSLEKNKESNEQYIGNTLTLFINYTGPSDDFTYKWFKDDNVIDDANKSELFINKLSNSDSGNYKVIITGVNGDQSSNILNISTRDPLITIICPSEAVHIGGSVTLRVINEEITVPSSYKWKRNGVNIDAPDSNKYNIKTITEENAGVYHLEVTNELGVFLSEPSTLKVRDPVINLEYPKTAMPIGDDLKINVWSKEINIASTYEWFKDGKKLIDQTSESLIIQNLKAEDTGKYNVIVKNELGSFSSSLINFEVNQNVKLFYKLKNLSDTSKINTAPSLSLDGLLHVTTNKKEVLAININGELEWKYTLGAKAADSPVIGNDGSVYVVSEDDNIYGINKDGSTRWIYKTEGTLSSTPALSDSDILYVGYGKTKYYTRINSAALENSKHKYEEDSELMGGIAGSDHRLSNKSSGGLLAINSVTGDLIWELKDKIDTTVYLNGEWGNWSNDGYRTYATTGAGCCDIEILYETGSHFKYSPVIAPNNTIYASANEYVYAIDGNSGNIIWKTKVGYARVCSPLSLINSNQILFGTYGISHEVQTKPGGEFINDWGNWESYPPTYGIEWLESPKVNSINIKSGKLQWSKPHDRMTKAAITGTGQHIYLTIDSNSYITLEKKKWNVSKSQLIKLNASTGRTVKSLTFDNQNAPYSVINADNSVLHSDGLSLNLRDIKGRTINLANFSETIDISPIINITGQIYIPVNNNIYVINGTSLANSQWPMTNANPQRTGSEFSVISILEEPRTTETRIGEEVVLKVNASSITAIKYQWYKNDVAIKGATDKSYIITELKASDYGSYMVKIISGKYVRDSKEVQIMPIQPPFIVLQPININSELGGQITFTVKAKSHIPMDFKWYKDGDIISGKNDAIFTIEAVTLDDYSRYHVSVINEIGKVDSQIVELIPFGMTTLSPVITDQPSVKIVRVGQPLEISVKVDGLNPRFQWLKDGKAISNLIGDKLLIEEVSISDYGYYSIKVSNDHGEANSNPIEVIPFGVGKKDWSFKTATNINSSPAIGSDGTVYVGSNDDNLYAINPDGSNKWIYKTGGNVESSPAISSDGTIYVGSVDYHLHAVNPDGSKKWVYKTGQKVKSSPAIGDDGTVYVGSYDYNLYAINPDGSKKWAFKTGYYVVSSPAIGGDGTVYVGSGDSHLYAINPDGTMKWVYETSGNVNSSPSIGSDGTIYVGSNDDNLHAINPDGSKKWAYKTGGNVDSSAAIGSDGTIYVGSWDDNLYAIDPDGFKKWFYKTGGNVKSSPAIGSDGNIYFGSLDDNLYAISPDGSRKWVYQTESNVNSSPAIGANGSIYIGSSKGIMYSINSSSFGLANSPWAAYGQNSNRTARIPLLVADQIKITSFNNHAALFTLSFETKSDSTYTIEVTQDLKQWDEIGEVQGTGSSVNFTDPRLPVIPFERNYFRVKLEE